MTRICVSTPIASPVEVTERLLLAYMNERAGSDGGVALSLRVPLTRRIGDLALVHDVVARGHWGRDSDNLNQNLAITWSSAGGGPYPNFGGVMNVYAEPDRRMSRLEIDGTYEPPGGLVGRVFDALVGSRIARASLAGLVDDIARAISPVTSSGSRR